MTTERDIELKLSEYRARHTGKDPFGPWTDLKNLHASLDEQGQMVFEAVLQKNRTDAFWKEFIELFEQGRSANHQSI